MYDSSGTPIYPPTTRIAFDNDQRYVHGWRPCRSTTDALKALDAARDADAKRRAKSVETVRGDTD